jgi:hypothetical protein
MAKLNYTKEQWRAQVNASKTAQDTTDITTMKDLVIGAINGGLEEVWVADDAKCIDEVNALLNVDGFQIKTIGDANPSNNKIKVRVREYNG